MKLFDELCKTYQLSRDCLINIYDYSTSPRACKLFISEKVYYSPRYGICIRNLLKKIWLECEHEVTVRLI